MSGAKQFDWAKAARLIEERKPEGAVDAGLAEDWYWTAATIWENGKPVIPDMFAAHLSSTWATPTIRFPTAEGHEDIECWVPREGNFDPCRHWPDLPRPELIRGAP